MEILWLLMKFINETMHLCNMKTANYATASLQSTGHFFGRIRSSFHVEGTAYRSLKSPDTSSLHHGFPFPSLWHSLPSFFLPSSVRCLPPCIAAAISNLLAKWRHSQRTPPKIGLSYREDGALSRFRRLRGPPCACARASRLPTGEWLQAAGL